MNLIEAIRIYVAYKRGHGHLYIAHEKRLRYFSRDVGDIPLENISVRQVLTHLDTRRTSAIFWKKKHEMLSGFFDFWLAREAIVVSPMPPKSNAKADASVPYIYTRSEIRRLLLAACTYQQGKRCIDSHSMSTFLVFLYGTGCLVSEAIQLSTKDVDLNRGVIFIRSRNQLRELPIGTDLKKLLRDYLEVRKRARWSSDLFFLTKQGMPFGKPTINKSFQRVRDTAGIMRRDGAYYQPRMQDLRHTFAVHRISSWIKHGADLKRMLPALSVYMGLSGLGTTEKYLSLTAERFRPQLFQLSPSRRRKRWRDDRELMKFLDSL